MLNASILSCKKETAFLSILEQKFWSKFPLNTKGLDSEYKCIALCYNGGKNRLTSTSEQSSSNFIRAGIFISY